MKLYQSKRCKNCDCLMWSDHAKSLQLCPECEITDQDKTKTRTKQASILEWLF